MEVPIEATIEVHSKILGVFRVLDAGALNGELLMGKLEVSILGEEDSAFLVFAILAFLTLKLISKFNFDLIHPT